MFRHGFPVGPRWCLSESRGDGKMLPGAARGLVPGSGNPWAFADSTQEKSAIAPTVAVQRASWQSLCMASCWGLILANVLVRKCSGSHERVTLLCRLTSYQYGP